MMPAVDGSLVFLWDNRMLYIADRLDTVKGSTAVPVLIIGFDDVFSISVSDGVVAKTRAALVPPGTDMTINHYGKAVAYIYLNPLSADYLRLSSLMKYQNSDLRYESDSLSDWLSMLQLIRCSPRSAVSLSNLITNSLFKNISVVKASSWKHLDIKACIEIIDKNLEKNISNENIAKLLGITVWQLQRKFKAVMGVPIRRYRSWHRLYVTTALMGYGCSITDACLEAGFSDSPHFIHTYRNIVGLKPSFVLKRKGSTNILVDSSNDHFCSLYLERQYSIAGS
ncbi:MAG: AraC family transcriptional regulator [Pseudomonadales bacterium]|nr:AraC family transcriptional regulator [Pseudomonadales bacterium]